MVPAVIISPDPGLAAELEAALTEIGQVVVVRKLNGYPTEQDLGRIIRALAPKIFFLSVASVEEALRVAKQIEACAPGIQIMAFERDCDQGTLLELMRAGIREFVSIPLTIHELPNALLRLNAALERKPPGIESTDLLFSFLPAKPGAGCSTVALNLSVALAAVPGTKVLLADFDLTCGMIGFLLHLDNSRSVVDAAEHAAHLDESLWPKLVHSVGDLDILVTGVPKPGFRIESAQLRYLLEFARRNYQAVCLDLSGLLERYSIELMQESKRIFVVTTPELPSLHLAQQRIDFLRGLELEGRVSLILNRAQRNPLIPSSEIEKMIGLPVAIEFPNDYKGVHKAFTEAKPIDPSSELGKRFQQFARKLLSKGAEPPPSKRFVDYFTISPARFSFHDSARRRE
jgi:pilus assembly protein CpaE